MRKNALFVACLLAIAPSAALAGALDMPTGPVLLTVTGQISNTNTTGSAQFDLAMLDALSQHTIETETPWYDNAQSFSGPLGSALLDAVGAEGTTVTVTALNDYSADIPVADFREYPVILASRINGKELSIRDKGPLFVIYPFDAEPSLYNEVYFGRSVWQITAINVH